MEQGVKRYYYTDPLAAAWQEKQFGMRFVSEHGDELYLGGFGYTWGGGGGY